MKNVWQYQKHTKQSIHEVFEVYVQQPSTVTMLHIQLQII